MNVIDFRRGAEAARLTINRWVEDKSKQKIRDLIFTGALRADTRLVLVNAVYFKGMWALQFRKAATEEEPFYLEGGGKVRAPLMHQSGEVRYLQAGGFQAVDLDQLHALGMPLAFERYQADFSGINGLEPPHEDSLFISGVFHKAFVEVNEVGTEAAAATAAGMDRMASRRSTPPPVPIFRADHPFLFAIRDRKSGVILFLGRMADPTQ